MSICQYLWRDYTQNIIRKLTINPKAVLDYIKVNPSASRKEIAEDFPDITEDGIKYILKGLQTMGLIKRIGSANGGHRRIEG